MEPNESPTRVYRVEDSAFQAWMWFAAGIGLISVAAVGFFIAVRGQVGQFQLQALSTLPTVMAVAAFAKAWVARRQPREIEVSPRGLKVTRGTRQDSIDWDHIVWAAVDKTSLSQQPRLRAYDARGTKLLSVSDSLPGFEELVARVKSELAGRYGENSEAIRMRKARRGAIFMVGASLFLILIVVANLLLTRDRERAKELLRTDGVPGTAKVVRRFIAPNGVTRRLEYEVRGADNQPGTRNAEVSPIYYDEIADAETVPVVYVPSEPKISRLANGEVIKADISDKPAVMYGLCAALSILCIVFLAAAAFQWKGYEIDYNKETRKFSIKPFGTST
jgi:hypothetical protein